MKNIKDVLWDKECTGVDEYLTRRQFYGYMSPTGDLETAPSESPMDDYMCDNSGFDYDYSYIDPEEDETPFKAMWEYKWDEELWRYSLKGIRGILI